MAIKITDNTANRPMLPGTGARGLDANPERNFGNAVARPFQAPEVPRGYAGASSDMAGADMQAASRAAEQVTNSLVNTAQYFDNLQIAEEDTRGTVALHKVRESEVALRKSLAIEAAENNWSNDEYGAQYTERLSGIRDTIFTDANLSHKKVVAHYGKAWLTEQAGFHNGFSERVLAPRAVSQTVKAANDITDSIVSTVMADGSVEAATQGFASITAHFTKPEVVGTLGADKAAAAASQATQRLAMAVVRKKVDDAIDVEHGPLAGLTGDPINDAAIKGDVKGQIRFTLENMPIPADARLELWQRAERDIDQTAHTKIVAATHELNAESRRVVGEQKLAMQVTGNALTEQLINGSLTRTRLQQATNNLLQNSLFAKDPAARADVESMRLRFLDNVRAQEKAAAAAAAASSLNIAFTTDKEAETAFKKQFGTADIAALKPAQLPAAFAVLASPQYMVLPTSVRDRIGTMVMSHDRVEAQRGLILYDALAKAAPLLLDSLHKDVRAMASRVSEGQSMADARAAVIAQAQMSPEAVHAADQQGREWLREQTRGTDHPLKKVIKGVDNLPPSALAAYQREFNDAVRRGEPPAAASAFANARVGKSFGTSSLLSFDGKTKVATMAAPETVYGVQDPDIIKRDVLDALGPFGITKDTKWKMQPVPNGRDMKNGGAQTYIIVKQNDDGSESIVTDNGRTFQYSFSQTNNVDVRRKLDGHRNDDIVANYNRLAAAAVKAGSLKVRPNEQYLLYGKYGNVTNASTLPLFSKDLWDQAVRLQKD